jgi:hypothetical protein
MWSVQTVGQYCSVEPPGSGALGKQVYEFFATWVVDYIRM